jgi:hypothetical protein
MPVSRRARSAVVVERDALDADLARVMALQPVDAADQRRLARAGGAADHHALAAPHRQRHVVERREAAEALADRLHLDDRLGSSAASVISSLRSRWHLPSQSL